MPAIPNELVPTIQGYAIGAPAGVERIQPAGGAARYVLRWDRGVQPFQIRMVHDAEKFSVWTAFYLHVVKKGTIAFDMPLDSGFGTEQHECNIVPGTYSAAREGAHTVVTFTVEAESGAYALTAGQAETLIAAYNGYASTDPPEIPRGFKPVVMGYSFEAPQGAVRSEIDGGAPGYAAFTERDIQRFSVSLVLTPTQMAAWTAFLHHKLAKGAIAFRMPIDSGSGAETHSVNVLPGSYSAVRNGGYWIVTFAVEGESVVYEMTAGEAEDLVEIYNDVGPGLSRLFARIAQFANEDTLVLDL
jgi:hypothetical protein